MFPQLSSMYMVETQIAKIATIKRVPGNTQAYEFNLHIYIWHQFGEFTSQSDDEFYYKSCPSSRAHFELPYSRNVFASIKKQMFVICRKYNSNNSICSLMVRSHCTEPWAGTGEGPLGPGPEKTGYRTHCQIFCSCSPSRVPLLYSMNMSA